LIFCNLFGYCILVFGHSIVNPLGALGGVVSPEVVAAETTLEIPEILGTSFL
jgi:hypothetical protein